MGTEDGRLFERHWNDISKPVRFFLGAGEGYLCERYWDNATRQWHWGSHGGW